MVGDTIECITKILSTNSIKSVYTNELYEPYLHKLDQKVGQLLEQNGVEFKSYRDHILLPWDQVTKSDGSPFKVFTPFKNTWIKTLKNNDLLSYDSDNHLKNFYKCEPENDLQPEDIGEIGPLMTLEANELHPNFLINYKRDRDFPGIEGTSKLSLSLRYGTCSIREVYSKTLGSDTFSSELIWREFYNSILCHFPRIIHSSFNQVYDRIEWKNDPEDFERWKNGETGIPLVDAGMRQLNQTGWMHNRVRMVVASFLVKNLLIDWRWGEAYFAEKLLDYEMASNVGGWQWAAGCGVDAAPYFRVFNPEIQRQKFDPLGHYTEKWVPEFRQSSYPRPMVDLASSRLNAIEVYKKALSR